MTYASRQRPGKPLVALGCLLSVWAVSRLALWQSPFPPPLPDLDLPGFIAQQAAGDAPVAGTVRDQPIAAVSGRQRQVVGAKPSHPDQSRYNLANASVYQSGGESRAVRTDALTLSAHHQILFAAGLSYAPSPVRLSELLAVRDGASQSAAVSTGDVRPWPGPIGSGSAGGHIQSDRWSFDGWSLWRAGSSDAVAGAGLQPSYGASQAGGVVRFRLSQQGRHSPQIHLRATQTLVSRGESEVAVGASVRPVAKLGLRAHGELRASRRPGNVEIRPAAFVTTEFPAEELPLGVRGTFYAQGGYVGGDFSTFFADGQMGADTSVARFDLGDLRVGGGAWGGVQEDAARLDIGPTASISLEKGPVPARLSVDYRVRVAGDAEPGSGVAVTLTTGF